MITLTELRYGVERMPVGNPRVRLDSWIVNELPLRFEGRILPINPIVAEVCGRIVARSEAAGRRMEVTDAFIAATANVHRLTVVTRNVSELEVAITNILNPWN